MDLAVAFWSPFLLLLASLGLRPAASWAKARWVYPRTGRVTYPDPEEAPPTHPSLGLSPATGRATGSVPRSRLGRLGSVLPALLIASLGPLSMDAGGWPGLFKGLGLGEAGGHLAVGSSLAAALLLAAWRWSQHRWFVLAVACALLGLILASSGLDLDRALALRAAGIAAAFLASGGAALASHLHHAPGRVPEADGR